MADELGEGAGALALAVAENPHHCDFEIIVQNRDRHATEKGKCRDVPIEKSLGRLRRIGLDETGVRLRQSSFIRTPPMTPMHSPKSTCAWPGGWASGTKTTRDLARAIRT